jgi:hypothetical protein
VKKTVNPQSARRLRGTAPIMPVSDRDDAVVAGADALAAKR